MTIFSSTNIILKIWRFIPIFWPFSEIKNLHHIIYFSTLKDILSFVFAMQLFLLEILVRNNEEWIIIFFYLRMPVMIFLYFMMFNIRIVRLKKKILPVKQCALRYPIDHIRMCSPRKISVSYYARVKSVVMAIEQWNTSHIATMLQWINQFDTISFIVIVYVNGGITNEAIVVIYIKLWSVADRIVKTIKNFN